jgi:protein OS-9
VPSPAAKSSLGPGVVQSEDPWDGILKRTIEATVDALMNTPEFQSLSGENAQVVFGRGENGEIVIEILEEIPLDNIGGEERNADNYADLTELLRKAGYQLKNGGEKEQEDGEATDGQGESEESHKRKEEL